MLVSVLYRQPPRTRANAGTDQLTAYIEDLAAHLRQERNLAPSVEAPTSEIMAWIGALMSERYRQMLPQQGVTQ